jgi:DNA-binding CsgD family transcriptional regulator
MLSGSFSKNNGGAGVATLDFAAFPSLCSIVATRQNPESPRNPRVTLLTEAERDCLRLVFQHMTSKDIARQLGVSPHTVDMRLRQAIRKLEVTNRIEAARALVHTEILLGVAQPIADQAAEDAYQELIYQASEIAADANSVTIGAPASQEPGAASNRSSDPNQLEHGSLARTLHPALGNPDVGPSGGSLAQPGASSGNIASATLATDWPGIAAPDPGIGARPFHSSSAQSTPFHETRPWGQKNDLGIGHRLGWIMAISMASALSFGGILAALAALKALL